MSKQSERKRKELKALNGISKYGSPKINNKKDNAASNPNASQRTANDGGGEIPPVNENKLGVLTRDAIGFGACGVLAAACFGVEHKIIGLWFTLIALVSVLHIPFHYLAKSNPLKKSPIWACFAILIFVIFSGCLAWSYNILHPKVFGEPKPFVLTTTSPEPSKTRIEDEIVRQSQLAQARQWQPPELAPDTPRQNGKILVQLTIGGAATSVWPTGSEEEEMAPNKSVPFIMPGGGRVVIPYVKNNRVFVKVETMFGDTEQTIQMNNEWPVRIPDGWERNFNANSFEIVDDTKLPVLQIRYVAANVIEVNGIFVSKNGSVRIAFDGEQGIAARFVKSYMLKNIPNRKAWFKYPSTNHLGELAN